MNCQFCNNEPVGLGTLFDKTQTAAGKTITIYTCAICRPILHAIYNRVHREHKPINQTNQRYAAILKRIGIIDDYEIKDDSLCPIGHIGDDPPKDDETYIPEFEEIENLPASVLPVGRYDASLIEATATVGGTPTIGIEFQLDNGKYEGQRIKDQFTILPGCEYDLRRLKNLALAIGIKWVKYSDITTFAQQFVRQEQTQLEPYRVSVVVQHSYQIFIAASDTAAYDRATIEAYANTWQIVTLERYRGNPPQSRRILCYIERYMQPTGISLIRYATPTHLETPPEYRDDREGGTL